MTNDRHSGARIIEVRPIRVQDELERGKIVIVAGFQGVSYRREITTLGRGGSDTTAVALAAALGAEYCEICPTSTASTRPTRAIVEARSSSTRFVRRDAGARRARRARPQPAGRRVARKAGIAIYARATDKPPALDGGTRVGGPPVSGGARGCAVTGMKDLTRVRASARLAGELRASLARDGVALKRFAADEQGATAVFTRDDLPDWPSVRARLPEGCQIEEDLAAASVVGEGVGSDPTSLERALAAAKQLGAELVGHDASPLRVTLYLAPAKLDELVRALHKVFAEA